MDDVGTLSPQMIADVREILRLQSEEAAIRCSARIYELVPANRPLARDLFFQANDLRRQRRSLLERCGLLD